MPPTPTSKNQCWPDLQSGTAPKAQYRTQTMDSATGSPSDRAPGSEDVSARWKRWIDEPSLWAVGPSAPQFDIRILNDFEPHPMSCREISNLVRAGLRSAGLLFLRPVGEAEDLWIPASVLKIVDPKNRIPNVAGVDPSQRVGVTVPGTSVRWSQIDAETGMKRAALMHVANIAAILHDGIVSKDWSDEEIKRLLAEVALRQADSVCYEFEDVMASIAPIPAHVAGRREIFRQYGFRVDRIVRGVMSYPTHAPPEVVLAGDEWLRRGDIVLFNSSAGAGKSVAAFHLSMCWPLGLPYLGILPSKPLRILHFAGEDDGVTAGQCREGLIAHAEALFGKPLGPDDLQGLDSMLRTEHGQRLSGDAFIAHVDRLLQAEPVDVVILNPMLSFVVGDLVSEVGGFLRQKLAVLAEKHDCAFLIFHHTTKLSKKSWEELDPIYSGTGGAEPANVGRSILCLAPTPVPGLHVLHVGKRKSTGWTDEAGNFVDKVYVKRGTNPKRPAWLPVSHAEAAELIGEAKGKKGSSKKCSAEYVVAVLRENDGRAWRGELLNLIARACDCSVATAKKSLDEARHAGLISEVAKKPQNGGQKQIWLFLPEEGEGGEAKVA